MTDTGGISRSRDVYFSLSLLGVYNPLLTKENISIKMKGEDMNGNYVFLYKKKNKIIVAKNNFNYFSQLHI